VCISAEYLGFYEGFAFIQAKLRPAVWFLTQTSDCKVFQEMSTMDIVKQVLRDNGISDFQDKTTGSYPKRTYCVQYRETDFDFIMRLMEEDGIFFWWDHEKSKVTMVFGDDVGSHKPLPDNATVPFYLKESGEGDFLGYRRKDDHIFEWMGGDSVNTGHVSLTDFNFEKPSADLATANKIPPRGNSKHTKYEIYDYPARYHEIQPGKNAGSTGSPGTDFARKRMEAFAVERKTRRGQSNIRQMEIGFKFKLDKHPRKVDNGKEFMITRCRHQLQIDADYDTGEITRSVLGHPLQFNREDNPDTYRSIFEVIPADEPFRPPQKTEKPRIPSIQTAIVVGPSGDEIYTDKYGRVKVQFHWDRLGKNNEKSSCWLRYAVPWSGKNWGWVGIPRIGQEVVVQFEEGDPDRPMITGMLYNAETMPTYTLPANMTQTGIKTRSTKKGSAQNYHELVFEDKKGEEFIRFHSEKDYFQVVENNADVKIGFEKKDKGDLTHGIKNDETREVGNNRTLTVGNNHTETVKGNQKHTINKNRTQTVKGNETVKILKNKSDKISKNYNITVGQKMTVKATQKITLKCGGSSITMTPAAITMKSTNITVKANANMKAQAGVNAQIKGGVGIKLQGGVKADLKGGVMTKIKGGVMLKAQGGVMAKVKGGVMGQFQGGALGQFKGGGICIVKGALTMIN
jgi:type VI secretion system secreted protein VgrG